MAESLFEGMIFSLRPLLVKHKEKQHEISEYPCMLCDFVGKKYSYLKQHVEAHHEEGKFHCDQCTYVASTKSRLKVHIESKENHHNIETRLHQAQRVIVI